MNTTAGEGDSMEALSVADAEADQGALRCPRCGSYEIHEFRQAIIRYRVTRTSSKAEAILRESEDPIFHRCVDCGYASSDDHWEIFGRSEFFPPRRCTP